MALNSKIWECSLDLVEYIYEAFGSSREIKSALELGCGHGLPGVAAANCGFSPIVFSDFNDDVTPSFHLFDII